MDLITYNTMRSKKQTRYTYISYYPYYYCPKPIKVKPRERPFNTTIITAYDLAVKNGFEGTEKQWLESLKPKIGDNGHWFIGDTDTGVIADASSLFDYNALANKPSINGQLLQGDVDLESISDDYINALFVEKIQLKND